MRSVKMKVGLLALYVTTSVYGIESTLSFQRAKDIAKETMLGALIGSGMGFALVPSTLVAMKGLNIFIGMDLPKKELYAMFNEGVIPFSVIGGMIGGYCGFMEALNNNSNGTTAAHTRRNFNSSV